MSDEIKLPEIDPPPDPAKKQPELPSQLKPLPPAPDPGGFEGCLIAGVKVIGVLVIGIFVLGGLIFATCLLGVR
jgi:hypothetical protein